MPDFTIKAGTTRPILHDTLTYSDGTSPDLTGATVTFVMRSTTATTAAINAAATVVNPTNPATVSYTFTAADTAVAGGYLGEWQVTFAGGATLIFPTDGYLDIWIEESLTGAAQTIVPLADMKDYLRIPASDRTHDQALARFIRAATPVIQHITGPIIETEYDEWYDGGHIWLTTRHRPIITLVSVSEYLGPVEYPLTIVQDPAHGSVYSCMLDKDGRITRRGPGGSVQPFAAGPDTVHVVYTAGRASVPENVRLATLELIRDNYQPTQQAGRPSVTQGPAADVPQGPAFNFVSPRVMELLVPNRRHPSVF